MPPAPLSGSLSFCFALALLARRAVPPSTTLNDSNLRNWIWIKIKRAMRPEKKFLTTFCETHGVGREWEGGKG